MKVHYEKIRALLTTFVIDHIADDVTYIPPTINEIDDLLAGVADLVEPDEQEARLIPCGPQVVAEYAAYAQVVRALAEIDGKEEWNDEIAELQHIQGILRTKLRLADGIEARKYEETDQS